MIDNAIYGLLCVNYRCVHKGVSYYCKFIVDVIAKNKTIILIRNYLHI